MLLVADPQAAAQSSGIPHGLRHVDAALQVRGYHLLRDQIVDAHKPSV
jgi:hypothetical protein